MNKENATLKQKAAHEIAEWIAISVYLGFFFCAMATYRMILVNDFRDAWFNYSAALINALVIAKVILIGELAHVGRRSEKRPLLFSAIYKSLAYGLLVFAFHVVEEIVKHLIHGVPFAGALGRVRLDDLLGRALVVFCTFIPFFAFRELSRVLGEEKFRDLVFQHKSAA